jgi:hypothetical protein
MRMNSTQEMLHERAAHTHAARANELNPTTLANKRERPTGEMAASTVDVTGDGEDVAVATAARLHLVFSAAANPPLVFVARLGFFPNPS